MDKRTDTFKMTLQEAQPNADVREHTQFLTDCQVIIGPPAPILLHFVRRDFMATPKAGAVLKGAQW